MKHLSEASQSGSRSFAKLKLLFDIRTYFNLLRVFLTSEIFQVIVALLDLVCDVFFCVLYVINIQHALNHMDEIPLTLPGPSWLWVARLPVTFIMCAVLSYYTFISWVLELFWADNPIKQFFSFLTLVNAVTSFPFMFGVFFDIAKYLYLPFYLRSLVAIGHLRKVL
ncbi:hypothetical protein BCR33DRAFT_520703 [Rhizoclosmatium globosum]|uniref:Uncharacterized protein n=1 Tax=Rhizoclosmatium globosum TaxID=329046 RepID=A0A1Y2BF83_9FUNG|nr:hypothetical protein BCR33DRAFT_520703 [Rhizoclosmatium globosum]|eukprot:ORY33200.1 hypothetical protein BCR33DRAFT_520703 [Rhizoclosmatium globosum]